MVKVNKAKVANRTMTTITKATAGDNNNNKVDMAASNKADTASKGDTINSKVEMMISRADTEEDNKEGMEDNTVGMEDNKVDKAATMTRINRMDVNSRAETDTLIRATIKVPVMVCAIDTKWEVTVAGHGGRAQSGAPPTQGGWQGDFSGAAQVAQQHAGDSGEQSMFSQALQHMQSGNHQGPINEQDALDAHQQVYQGGGAGGLAAGSIGTAAALQALKGMLSGG